MGDVLMGTVSVGAILMGTESKVLMEVLASWT